MIKFQTGCHWYSRGGEAQHDADLRVARKEFLYPSVTTIDKDTFKNDFLDKWKMNELAAAAATTFKQAHESEEDYAQRIYEASLEKARIASEFGKEIHDAIEHYPQMPLDARLHPWLDKFGEWHEANVGEVVERESVLLDHDIGVAGRCDGVFIGKGKYDGKLILCDYKTQNVKKDDKGRSKASFYESWPRQLGFYACAYSKKKWLLPQIPTCLSVVLDSNEAAPPFVREWTLEEVRKHHQDFVVGAWLWFRKKKYWPIGEWMPFESKLNNF